MFIAWELPVIAKKSSNSHENDVIAKIEQKFSNNAHGDFLSGCKERGTEEGSAVVLWQKP